SIGCGTKSRFLEYLSHERGNLSNTCPSRIPEGHERERKTAVPSGHIAFRPQRTCSHPFDSITRTSQQRQHGKRPCRSDGVKPHTSYDKFGPELLRRSKRFHIRHGSIVIAEYRSLTLLPNRLNSSTQILFRRSGNREQVSQNFQRVGDATWW